MSYNRNKWVLRLTATTFALFGFDLVGVLEGVNYNQIWFQFITTFLNLIISVLFGADLTANTMQI